MKPFFPYLPNMGFVFIFTFHKFNDLYEGEKMNSLGDAGVGAKRSTLRKLPPSPLAYCFLPPLAPVSPWEVV